MIKNLHNDKLKALNNLVIVVYIVQKLNNKA